MKAVRVFWQKARVQDRYLLEMSIHQVGKSLRYPDGIKYGLILADPKSGRRLLMDNHHPKGPHIHVDDRELPYDFINEDRLVEDFKLLALTFMGVKL